MSSRHTVAGWRITHAQLRAIALGGGTTMAAVLTHRGDLLVLATPWLIVATWGWVTRPRDDIAASARIGNHSLSEGQATRWTATLELPAAAEEAIVRLASGTFVTSDPVHGHPTATPLADGGYVEVAIPARAVRWGVRRIGPGLVSARSPWWAYRTPIVEVGEFTVTVSPATADFEASAPTPHPEGLVGLNRSTRPGSGTEFAAIRPFQVGDRLRRIHWPSTARTGTLQVTTTYADQDAHVVLLVDAFSDLGPREGIDGRATSLDLTVRAAAALARHYARAGDRVSLRVLGMERARRLPPGTGMAHYRKVLDVLARIEPATDRELSTVNSVDGLTSGSLVIVLSPMVHPAMPGLVARVAARGIPVVVVDAMPEHLWTDQRDRFSSLAWRIRRLDRAQELARLRSAGVPVVPWVGAGSLDLVLRDLARRARAPRTVRR